MFSYNQNVIYRLCRALWWELHCLCDLLLTLVIFDSAAILSRLYTHVLLEESHISPFQDVTGAVTHISLLSVCCTAGSRRLRHVAAAVILVVVISNVATECDQLAVYEPFERSDVAEWEKMQIDFCILTETWWNVLSGFQKDCMLYCNRCCSYTVKPLSFVFLCVVFHTYYIINLLWSP